MGAAVPGGLGWPRARGAARSPSAETGELASGLCPHRLMQNPYVMLWLAKISIEASKLPIRSRHELTSSFEPFEAGIISRNYSERERVAQLNRAMCTGTSREEDMFQEGLASRQTLARIALIE